jgi:hypothetical protein
MTLRCTAAGFFEVGGALFARKMVQEGADASLGRFLGALGGGAQQVLELGEHLFERIEVG